MNLNYLRNRDDEIASMSKEEALIAISEAREEGFKEGIESAFDCIISKFEELKKRVTVLKDVVYLDGVLAIIEGEKNQLTNNKKEMKKKNNYRYVAYDAANGEYEEFETLKEAEDWLKKDDCEGISDEACCGQNYIAEIQYRSVFTKTDEKSNYHVHTDECPEDCDEEEWPYSDDFDYIGNHWYEKIEWEKNQLTNKYHE